MLGTLLMLEQVEHFVLKELDEGHSTPAWQLLAPESTSRVIRREYDDPIAKDKAWSCNHCAGHLHNYVPRSQAIDHVKTT